MTDRLVATELVIIPDTFNYVFARVHLGVNPQDPSFKTIVETICLESNQNVLEQAEEEQRIIKLRKPFDPAFVKKHFTKVLPTVIDRVNSSMEVIKCTSE